MKHNFETPGDHIIKAGNLALLGGILWNPIPDYSTILVESSRFPDGACDFIGLAVTFEKPMHKSERSRQECGCLIFRQFA